MQRGCSGGDSRGYSETQRDPDLTALEWGLQLGSAPGWEGGTAMANIGGTEGARAKELRTVIEAVGGLLGVTASTDREEDTAQRVWSSRGEGGGWDSIRTQKVADLTALGGGLHSC